MKLIVLFFILSIEASLLGQVGANYIAAGSNLANSDAGECLANNPSSLPKNKWSAGIWAINKYTGVNMNYGGFCVAFSSKLGAVGISSRYAGTAYLNRTAIELNIGKKISDYFSLGFSGGLLKNNLIQNYPQKTIPLGRVGFEAKINSKIIASAVICNPWELKENWHETANRTDIALQYFMNKNTNATLLFRTQLNIENVYGIGFSHKVGDKIHFIGSLQTGFQPISLGISFLQKNFHFNIACNYHNYLGFSPAFTLGWNHL
ncbi:MAG: hypothetical protein IT244_07845 [Bacteroidia bacterium]|nr:hypothetical protein [Bacteroidia bacterium]